MSHLIHDIKTERPSLSGGLPPALKLIPIAFYLTSVVAVALSCYFLLSKKGYEHKTSEMALRVSEANTTKNQFNKQQEEIKQETKRATDYAKWLEASQPVQPLASAIARSMPQGTTIAELSLNRSPEIPAHTFMQLKIDNADTGQIESTLSAITALNIQSYSAQQVKRRSATDFQTTLIYSQSN